MARSSTFVLFTLAKVQFALDADCVERVLPAMLPFELPGAPAIVLGAINLHGRLIPVINTPSRLCLYKEEIHPNNKLIVASTNARVLALLVHDVTDVVSMPSDEIDSSECVIDGLEHISGIAKLKNGIVLIHDLSTFLSPNEENELNEACNTLSEA